MPREAVHTYPLKAFNARLLPLSMMSICMSDFPLFSKIIRGKGQFGEGKGKGYGAGIYHTYWGGFTHSVIQNSCFLLSATLTDPKQIYNPNVRRYQKIPELETTEG